MAKKVTGYIKLQIPAGKATPAPPVGPALGQHPCSYHCIRRQKFQLYNQNSTSCSFAEESL